ncbi:protocatechuate dioxygenase [Cryptosporangium sp. NPDC048952]|uniref:dioxygenase family protein n=1 Tax=Cryptosporangium sp. NPDC048952 TaxID=3363961 RepID=UPI0037118C90
MRQIAGSGSGSLTRRKLLALGAAVPLLAACRTAPGGAGGEITGETVHAATLALLQGAATCRPSRQLAQGPYWFDVDRLRSDIRETRRGTTLQLAIRVVDGAGCGRAPLPDVVVEIWHCDATGRYSGFEGPDRTAPADPPPGWPNTRGVELPAADPTGDPMGYDVRTSNGSYSRGDAEAQPGDDGTYLRGAQVTGANGIARFTTIYPGWYVGRAPHVHVKVYARRTTVLSTQLFLDDTVNDQVYRAAPYRARPPRNRADAFYDPSLRLTVRRYGDAYLGAVNLGVDLLGVPPGAVGTLGG